MNLVSLAYVSAAFEPFAPSDLLDLLARSRERNAKAGITGLLLYKGGNFLQVLEGDADVVEDLKTRIARDPRHHSMIVVSFRPIGRREFGEWSMAFTNLDAAVEAGRPGFSDFLSTDLTVAGIGGRLAPLLESFRRTMR